jgi:hypothetical protein
MTQAKIVATSLKTILQNELVKAILDRSKNIDGSIIDEVKSWWGYDLFTRKPNPAYDMYGVFKGTDLDLACFLYELSGRGAIINIPIYKSHTQAKNRTDQKISSKYNRHGLITGVNANKHFFSFNVNIIDQNVIGEDKIGDFRTFSLTDKFGEWYKGWKVIEFVPTLKENRFITENRLWTGNKIIFKNFIHPNRWTSFFGHHYVITKLLIERLEDEAQFLFMEMKRLLESGITYPEDTGPKSYDYEYGKSVQKKFPAFECKIYIPETQISGDYNFIEETQEGLVRAHKTRNYYLYSLIPKLSFMTRASEYAHYKNPDRFPSWLKNVQWESGFKIPPRGRTTYERLKLFQPKVGEHSVSILKRSYEKSATVAE